MDNLSFNTSEVGCIVHSGATNYLSDDANIFSSLIPYQGSSSIVVGNGMFVPISHFGQTSIPCSFTNFSSPDFLEL